jgi:DNA polymerase IV
MSDKELAAKIAYFKEQELLDISDDETGFPDAGLQNAERAFADTKAMPPPRLVRQRSSFLGPTPKQSQADFEAQTARLRTIAHNDVHGLIRLVTAPEAETAKSFPSAKRNSDVMPQEAGPRKKLRHTTSLPKLNTTAQFGEEVPFYKRMGIVPREVKNGKNVKRAENIKLEPENKQLLKGKIICTQAESIHAYTKLICV